MKYEWFAFAELSANDLYALLKLRAEVFVWEQQCAFVDPDGLDARAWHLLVRDKGGVVGCARVFPPATEIAATAPASASLRPGVVSIGRIVTAQTHRSQGVGRSILKTSVDWASGKFPDAQIQIGAQARLRAFYESLGFCVSGAAYLEDGIAHLPMRLERSS